MFRRFNLISVFTCFCVVCLVGCGSDGMEGLVKVKGKVLYKGKPLAHGTIVYLPVDRDSGRQASGGIQPDGTFVLTTIKKGDGVLKGKYRIAIYAYAPHPGEPGRGANSTAAPKEIKRGYIIPKKYASAATSGLEDTVDENHSGYKEYTLSD